jgi:hypothetical protein
MIEDLFSNIGQRKGRRVSKSLIDYNQIRLQFGKEKRKVVNPR